MAAAIGVRVDYTSLDLRRFSRRCNDPDQVRRLLALGLILNGEQRRALAEQVEAGPIPAAHGVVRGASSIWHSGCGTSSACRSPGRRLYQVALTVNFGMIPLPPRCPELNPVENVWQFMRDNWLSNRIFSSYDDIVDHCCFAWNRLVDQPWLIMSIGIRQSAHAF